VSQLLTDTVSYRQTKQVPDKHSLRQRTSCQPGILYEQITRGRQSPLAPFTHLTHGQARKLNPPAGKSRVIHSDTRLSHNQAPQVTAWRSHAHPTLPHQVISRPKQTLPLPHRCPHGGAVLDRVGPACSRSSSQARASCCRPHAGAQIAALAPDQVAGAARQQRRSRLPALNAGELGRGSVSPRRARKPQQALRQPRPPLPCRHTACPAARTVAAADTQPALHASRELLGPPGLRHPSAGRPGRLCALRQFCSEPISSATSRPHGRRAAAAQGALCARDRRTRCMLGLSPARACRAGRMPASLCAQHWRGARLPRR
jgi:hypothetical protein